MNPLLVGIILVITMTGCTTHPTRHPPSQPLPIEGRILLLDNSGGYSHPGRRIELLQDGILIETSYTDVIGSQRERNGSYIIEGNTLKMKFGDRGDQRLIRITYGDDIFWVYPNEVNKITSSDSLMLRQTSLKQK